VQHPLKRCLRSTSPPLEAPLRLEDGIISLKLNRLLIPPLLATLRRPRSPYEMPLPDISGLIRPESMARSIDLLASENGVSTFSPVSDDTSRKRAPIKIEQRDIKDTFCYLASPLGMNTHHSHRPIDSLLRSLLLCLLLCQACFQLRRQLDRVKLTP
jgi:hypothetical protein